jgi:hypothetical protein
MDVTNNLQTQCANNIKLAAEQSQDTAMLMVQFNFMHTLRNIDQNQRLESRRQGSIAVRRTHHRCHIDAC